MLQRPLVCHLSKIPFILGRAVLIFFVNLKCRGQNFSQREKFFFRLISQTNPTYTHKDWVHITGGIWKQLKKNNNLTTLHLRCIMFDFFRFKFTLTNIFRLLFTFYLSVETFNPNSNLLRDFRKQWYVSIINSIQFPLSKITGLNSHR